MTPSEQSEYYQRFHRFQLRKEREYIPVINKALKDQVRQYTKTGTVMAITSQSMTVALSKLYRDVAPKWALLSTVSIRRLKYRGPIGFNERIIQLMQQYYGVDLLNMSEDITETTIKQIKDVLSRAAETGIGFDDIVKQLESPDFTAKRARTIARTETLAAANSASRIAAKQTGLKMNKIWIAARDHRTRPDHVEVNQKVVGMNEDFIVGGMPMSHPGDKRGGAKECVNCRCTQAFIPLRDQQGRLVKV